MKERRAFTMEIRNLNTFLHAASLQNITRAAAELGYS